MYQDVSLRFYAGGPPLFELYTRYLYEKIFGEEFVARTGAKLESMRQDFHDRYAGRIEALVRLTEAQDPFFAALEENATSYAAIPCPVLVLAGAEDRAIPPSQQRRIGVRDPARRVRGDRGRGPRRVPREARNLLAAAEALFLDEGCRA